MLNDKKCNRFNFKKKLLRNIRKLCQKTNVSMNKMYIKIKTILLSVCDTVPQFCICIKNDPLLFLFLFIPHNLCCN